MWPQVLSNVHVINRLYHLVRCALSQSAPEIVQYLYKYLQYSVKV